MMLAGGRFTADQRRQLFLHRGAGLWDSLLQESAVHDGKVGECTGGDPLRGNNYIETATELRMLKG